jgi:hypothetical protein
MTDPRFWSDDFDMDLPKVIPDAKEMLGEHADLQLLTHGGKTYGRLNHPVVWNSETGTVAFFGRRSPMKPPAYYTDREIIGCTLWEAIRDAWAHTVVIVFEGRTPIWDGSKTWKQFEPIMYHIRGWEPLTDAELDRHKQSVRMRLELVPHFLRGVTQ